MLVRRKFDRGALGGFESRTPHRKLVAAGPDRGELEIAVGAGGRFAGRARGGGGESHASARDHATGFIGDGSGNGTGGLLRSRWEREQESGEQCCGAR